MKADSFLVSLFFDEKKTQMSADKVNSITKNMVKGVIGSVAVFASYSFLKSMVNDFAEGAAEAGKFASSVHSDVEAVDALCQSLAKNGGSVDGFKNSLTGMDNYIQKSVKGNKDAQNSFKHLGVSLRDAQGNLRETDKIMLDVADKFSNMSADKQDMFAAKMGIDSKTLGLMKQGKISLEEMIASQKANGAVTKQQVAMSKEYKQLLWDMDNAYKQVKNRIAESMMPYVLKFLRTVKDVTNYLKEHKGLVVGFFTAFATVITAKAIPAVLRFTAALLANPLTWMIALVVGLSAVIGILVDDYLGHKAGKNSLFGSIWDWVDKNITSIKVLGGVAFSMLTIWMGWGKEIRGVIGALKVLSKINALHNSGKSARHMIKLYRKLGTIGKVAGIFRKVGLAIGRFGAIAGSTLARVGLAIGRVASVFVSSMARIMIAFATNPIGLAIMAIIAVIGLLWYNWDTVVKYFKMSMAWIGDAISSVANSIDSALTDAFNSADKWCQDVENSISSAFSNAWNSVKTTTFDIWNSIVAFITDKIEWVMSKIKAITDIKDKVVGVFKSANSPNVARPSASTSIANSTSNSTKKTEVNTTTTVQKVEVNVQNGDPQSISKGIGNALERSLTPNFNGGLLA